jgi:hypothetical protein
MKINARWMNDCGGKKDFDGNLVSISTRYWPEDGGFYVITDERGLRKNDILGPCEAHATIGLRERGAEEDDEYGRLHKLTDETFTGDSYEAVRVQVEAWAQKQMDRVEEALRREFIK